jgi:hypothetical protein
MTWQYHLGNSSRKVCGRPLPRAFSRPTGLGASGLLVQEAEVQRNILVVRFLTLELTLGLIGVFRAPTRIIAVASIGLR